MKHIDNLFWRNNKLKNLPLEIWMDAFGFDGYYMVSNLGRIKSLGRWVPNGSSERFVKERIRRQALCKAGRLTCPFSVDNERFSINISGLIYQSFNPNKSWDNSRYCIIHKNKLQQDNRLINLKLGTISLSHSINNKKGLLPHIHKNNERRHLDCLKLTHKICMKCGIKKSIINYEYGRRVCKGCRSVYKKKRYATLIKARQLNKND